MDITIPGILSGQGGVGQAIAQTGEELGRAGRSIGDYLDNIQKNYDYNDAVVITGDLEIKLQDHATEFAQKDNGTNPKAFDEYKAEQKKIVEEATQKASAVNERVFDHVNKHSQIRVLDYSLQVNRALNVNLLKQSQVIDGEQADISLHAALGRGGSVFDNIMVAVGETETKISARDNLYGGNAPTVFKGVMAKSLQNALDYGLKDPEKSRGIIEMMKDPKAKEAIMGYLTPEGQSHVQGLLKAAHTEVTLENGMMLGSEIFKADTTGSLESMTDAVMATGADVDTKKAAVSQIKDWYSMRRTDEAKKEKDAKDKALSVLTPIALKRNGLNRPSDLSPSQWAELERDNPVFANQLQDKMRQEQDYEIRQRKQDNLLARQEKDLRQADNEQTIMMSDDFRTRDLKSDLVTGDLSLLRYNRLVKLQESMDPVKRESVKAALSKVNTGGGLAAALGGLEKHEEAMWKLRYSEIIKSFAQNNIDDPNFDAKLEAFMEKRVFSDMATSWFATDATDRTEKYTAALADADPLRNEAIALLMANKKPITEGNIRHVISQLKGKK
jgi:hypothetical protein